MWLIGSIFPSVSFSALVKPSTLIQASYMNPLKEQRVRWNQYKTRNGFFFLEFQMIVVFFSISVVFAIFHTLGTLFTPGKPLYPIPASYKDPLKKKKSKMRPTQSQKCFCFFLISVFFMFFSISVLLPFFILLGPFLPLVDPSTPIPAPCMDPKRKKELEETYTTPEIVSFF